MRRAVMRSLMCASCACRLGTTTYEAPNMYKRTFSIDTSLRAEYNYGLSGKGKSRTNEIRWKRQVAGRDTHSILDVQGEVLFGIHPVLLALGSTHRQHLYKLYLEDKQKHGNAVAMLSRIITLAKDCNVDIQNVSKKTLTYLSGNRPHQGVCLDASSLTIPALDLQDLMNRGLHVEDKALWLLLYNVQDPMNFGAILRSAFFLGVDRVIVPEVNSCALSPVVSKASAGALEVINLSRVPGNYRSMLQLTKAWQSAGGVVVGTASDSSGSQDVCSLEDFHVTAPTLIIVGNEGSGVDGDVLDLCDELLTITPPSQKAPELGVESLNVSVATGILLHWLQASRRKR